LRDRVFKKLFEVAEIAAFTPVERVAYEESVKIYRDLKNVMDTAVEESYSKGKLEGTLEGKLEGKLEIAREMAAAGIDPDMIRRITGLSDW
jgi:predicted transposase/invertase (TIGR01784 family)